MIKETKTRNISIDITKAIAIVLVIIGHCIQYGSGNNYWANQLYLDNEMYRIIYSFHMPLFMMISGYLFYSSLSNHDAKYIIVRKIESLLLPILSFSTIELVLHILIDKSIITPSFILNVYVSNLWFLWVLLFFSISFLIINKVFKDFSVIYIVLFFLVFVCPSSLKLLGFMYPYFLCGYYFNKQNLYKKVSPHKKFFTIITTIIYVLLIIFYNNDCYIFTTGLSIINNQHQLFVDIYRFLIGLVGSLSILSLVQLTDRVKNTKLFSCFKSIGTNSLGIYAISNIMFFFIVKRLSYDLIEYNYIIIVIETIFVLISSLFLLLLIKKNHIISFIMLGIRKNERKVK